MEILVDKTIEADPSADYPDYPAVLSIWGRDARDEAERFAGFVAFLKRKAVIEDYSQVALLLHSVREDHSGAYLAALEARAHSRRRGLLRPRRHHRVHGPSLAGGSGLMPCLFM